MMTGTDACLTLWWHVQDCSNCEIYRNLQKAATWSKLHREIEKRERFGESCIESCSHCLWERERERENGTNVWTFLLPPHQDEALANPRTSWSLSRLPQLLLSTLSAFTPLKSSLSLFCVFCCRVFMLLLMKETNKRIDVAANRLMKELAWLSFLLSSAVMSGSLAAMMSGFVILLLRGEAVMWEKQTRCCKRILWSSLRGW